MRVSFRYERRYVPMRSFAATLVSNRTRNATRCARFLRHLHCLSRVILTVMSYSSAIKTVTFRKKINENRYNYIKWLRVCFYVCMNVTGLDIYPFPTSPIGLAQMIVQCYCEWYDLGYNLDWQGINWTRPKYTSGCTLA